MRKQKMRDMLVVLPGISGSVLEKDRRELWGSLSSVGHFVTSLTKSLEALKLEAVDNNKDSDDLDGVTATRLVEGVTIIPGLVKIDGYAGLRKFLHHHFALTPTTINSDKPGNYLEFPYDWRRDNRFTARRLEQVIAQKLPRWRERSGNAQAKVILLVHSMGGLVSRYYLEVLGGWQTCRQLITFGTPFRGSVKQLNTLVNGFQGFGLDFTDHLRSFSSCYQLLPTYPTVFHQGGCHVPADIAWPELAKERVKDGYNFHVEIQEGVQAAYLKDILPVVGGKQNTLQSGRWEEGRLVCSPDLPGPVRSHLAGGDGTVPHFSAIPRLLDNAGSQFVVARHAAIHNEKHVLSQLRQPLFQTQTEIDAPLSKRGLGRPDDQAALLGLSLAEVYPANQPISIGASLTGGQQPHTGPLVADLERVDSPQPTQSLELTRQAEGWQTELALNAGLYRLTLHHPVVQEQLTDLFVVTE